MTTKESTHFGIYVDGTERESADVAPVLNPATEESFAVCAQADAADLDHAVDAARHAQLAWAQDSGARRSSLQQAADLIDLNRRGLARILTIEQGKPLLEAQRELARAAMWLRYYAQMTDEADVLRDGDDRFVVARKCPLGVVATITPWNYPLFILAWKLAPALRAGNALIAKPSPFTPASSIALARVIGPAFPPGIFNVLPGGDELGRAVVLHPGISKVSFTGSTATGRKIMAAAAQTLKRVTLELGGNDPAIVLQDVDIAATAKAIFWAAFLNSGQICMAVKRIYVHEQVLSEFVEHMTSMALATRLGNGLDPETELGPINNAPQLERVSELVEDARDAGATIHCGGNRLPRPGYFYPPTIVSDIGSDARLIQEEQFGTALPVIGFSDIDEAVWGANSSPYGLGSSIWASDVRRAESLASQLNAGTVWINQHRDLLPYAPFGGWGDSGIGYESGREGYDEFVKIQVLNSRRRSDAPDGLDDLRHPDERLSSS